MSKTDHSLLLKITLLIASTLTVMAGATISPSLPQIKEVFSDVENIGILTKLVLTIPALFIAIVSPLVGYVVDRFGRLKLLVVSVLIYAAGGTTGFYLDNLYLILVGRAFLGVAVGGIMTTVTTLIGDYFKGDERNHFMGLQAAFMAYGGVVFVTIGGLLADLDWRAPFLIYAFPLLILPLMLSQLYEPKIADQKGASHPGNVNASAPSWLVLGIYLVAFINMAAFYMVPTQLPFYLQSNMDVTNTLVGVAIAFATLSGGTASLFYKVLRTYCSYQAIYALTFLVTALGLGIIAFADQYIIVILGLICTGLGMGTLMPNTNTFLLTIAPENQRGRIMGGVTTAFFLGQFASPILISPLTTAFPLAHAFGYVAGFLALLGLGFGGNWLWKYKR